MPRLAGILETCLYVEDMARAHGFYSGVLGLARILEDGDRISVYEVTPAQVLILFKCGATLEPVETPGGRIPPHDGAGPVHLAFMVEDAAVDDWRQHLAASRIAIESEVTWPKRGRSLYFRDPDGHALELATPNLWSSLR
ncbi:lactoylglutathione lyase [Aureimonas endophytica]|uniref:Lactoylglutathione lyase n=1 Tax=Aureimonas endophytica TaxID=2027858 RepID=A0A916ZDS7_9HYPH|nr:VOC family protein [Aureimonas endophytica]GGD88691.1 lactoylglutathione lyase [Aureimonas endophytica]